MRSKKTNKQKQTNGRTNKRTNKIIRDKHKLIEILVVFRDSVQRGVVLVFREGKWLVDIYLLVKQAVNVADEVNQLV